ncbi:class I SAM-dependent methyltransferase [Nocardia australiensis]|uniref:class I SAM-dependent methyltransferase n=1 Tax=Nocardia australiensis TaxID=2887191 RepID=UPI001D14595F|nr:class I SAM-dependent methyltransferase [Nocardia australiensis]
MQPAEHQGALWGAHPLDWAEIQEPMMWPVFSDVLGRLSPWPGQTLLDIGCGAGAFVRLADALGARASGLDPSTALVRIAREQAPRAAFYIGGMEDLPFPDNQFAVVTAFNCLHFATNPGLAIAEAIRVTRPGGRIVVATWGPPSECDAVTYLLDLGALMPPPQPEPPTRPDLTDPTTLEALLTSAGAVPGRWWVVPCPWEYPDLSTALRGLLSTGPAALAIAHSGAAEVADAVAESISPYRRDDGSYLLDNTSHYLVAAVVAEG